MQRVEIAITQARLKGQDQLSDALEENTASFIEHWPAAKPILQRYPSHLNALLAKHLDDDVDWIDDALGLLEKSIENMNGHWPIVVHAFDKFKLDSLNKYELGLVAYCTLVMISNTTLEVLAKFLLEKLSLILKRVQIPTSWLLYPLISSSLGPHSALAIQLLDGCNVDHLEEPAEWIQWLETKLFTTTSLSPIISSLVSLLNNEFVSTCPLTLSIAYTHQLLTSNPDTLLPILKKTVAICRKEDWQGLLHVHFYLLSRTDQERASIIFQHLVPVFISTKDPSIINHTLTKLKQFLDSGSVLHSCSHERIGFKSLIIMCHYQPRLISFTLLPFLKVWLNRVISYSRGGLIFTPLQKKVNHDMDMTVLEALEDYSSSQTTNGRIQREIVPVLASIVFNALDLENEPMALALKSLFHFVEVGVLSVIGVWIKGLKRFSSVYRHALLQVHEQLARFYGLVADQLNGVETSQDFVQEILTNNVNPLMIHTDPDMASLGYEALSHYAVMAIPLLFPSVALPELVASCLDKGLGGLACLESWIRTEVQDMPRPVLKGLASSAGVDKNAWKQDQEATDFRRLNPDTSFVRILWDLGTVQLNASMAEKVLTCVESLELFPRVDWTPFLNVWKLNAETRERAFIFACNQVGTAESSSLLSYFNDTIQNSTLSFDVLCDVGILKLLGMAKVGTYITIDQALELIRGFLISPYSYSEKARIIETLREVKEWKELPQLLMEVVWTLPSQIESFDQESLLCQIANYLTPSDLPTMKNERDVCLNLQVLFLQPKFEHTKIGGVLQACLDMPGFERGIQVFRMCLCRCLSKRSTTPQEKSKFLIVMLDSIILNDDHALLIWMNLIPFVIRSLFAHFNENPLEYRQIQTDVLLRLLNVHMDSDLIHKRLASILSAIETSPDSMELDYMRACIMRVLSNKDSS